MSIGTLLMLISKQKWTFEPGAGDSRVFSIDYDSDTKFKVWAIPRPISRPRGGQNSIPIPILIPRLCKCYKVKYEEMFKFIEWSTQK